MSENIVVIYGSGASHASGYKVTIKKERGEVYKQIAPPTDQDFFKEIEDEFLKENYCALWSFKNIMFAGNSTAGMEEIWTAIDLNHKHITLDTYNWKEETELYKQESKKTRLDLRRIVGKMFESTLVLPYYLMDINLPNSFFNVSPVYNKYKFLGDCGRDFRCLIFDVYAGYDVLSEPDCYKSLHQLLESSGFNSISYITFNYDCYLENSLTYLNKKFKYIHSNFNSESIETILSGGIPIIKLHGSLNWEHNSNDSITQHDESHRQIKPDYNALDWTQPAIIPPTIFKQEINDDSRAADHLTRVILQQWKAAITILKNADKIIFVGYSFPPADYHSKRIFQISSMLRKRSDRGVLKILDCIGPNDNIEQRNEFLINIFGNDTDIKLQKDFKELVKSEEFQKFLKE